MSGLWYRDTDYLHMPLLRTKNAIDGAIRNFLHSHLFTASPDQTTLHTSEYFDYLEIMPNIVFILFVSIYLLYHELRIIAYTGQS